MKRLPTYAEIRGRISANIANSAFPPSHWDSFDEGHPTAISFIIGN